MRQYTRLIALSLLALSGAALAQQLQELGPGPEPGSQLFVDLTDLQIIADLRIVDIRTVPDRDSPRKSPKGEGEVVDYTVQRHTFDCAKSSFHVDSLMYYYIDGDYDTENYEPSEGWQPVVAGSLQDAVRKLVCAKTAQTK